MSPMLEDYRTPFLHANFGARVLGGSNHVSYARRLRDPFFTRKFRVTCSRWEQPCLPCSKTTRPLLYPQISGDVFSVGATMSPMLEDCRTPFLHANVGRRGLGGSNHVSHPPRLQDPFFTRKLRAKFQRGTRENVVQFAIALHRCALCRSAPTEDHRVHVGYSAFAPHRLHLFWSKTRTNP